jgi:hypothetical protein
LSERFDINSGIIFQPFRPFWGFFTKINVLEKSQSPCSRRFRGG